MAWQAKPKFSRPLPLGEESATRPEAVFGGAQCAEDVRWVELSEVEKLCAWPEVSRVVRLSALQGVL